MRASHADERGFVQVLLLMLIVLIAVLMIVAWLFGDGIGDGSDGQQRGESRTMTRQPTRSVESGLVIVTGSEYKVLDRVLSANQAEELVDFVARQGWGEVRLNCKSDATAQAEIELKVAIEKSGLSYVGNCFQNL